MRNDGTVAAANFTTAFGAAVGLDSTGAGAEMVADMSGAQLEMLVTVTPLTAPLFRLLLGDDVALNTSL